MKCLTLDIKCMYSEMGLNSKNFVLLSFALNLMLWLHIEQGEGIVKVGQNCMNSLHYLLIYFKSQCLECLYTRISLIVKKFIATTQVG